MAGGRAILLSFGLKGQVCVEVTTNLNVCDNGSFVIHDDQVRFDERRRVRYLWLNEDTERTAIGDLRKKLQNLIMAADASAVSKRTALHDMLQTFVSLASMPTKNRRGGWSAP